MVLDVFSSPRFRGEPLLSAEFSWQAGPQYPRLARILLRANPIMPASWSNFWNGYPRAGGLRVVTADEQGDEFDPVVYEMAGMAEDNGRQYDVADIPVFPRRGQKVHLRLFAGNGKLLAEFAIPNPAPGPHPEWTAHPLPAHETNGDLEVTLAEFRAIQPRPGNGRFQRTECVFKFREHEHETVGWRPVLLDVSDATGNHWRPRWGGANLYSSRVEDGSVRAEFSGALWPSESAWKLRGEFKKVADFPESELLQIEKIRIPDADEIYEPHVHYERNGATVEVVGVIGKNVDQQRLYRERRHFARVPYTRGVNVALAGEILAQNRRLVFVSATDDQGRSVPLADFGEPVDIEDAKDWRPYSFVIRPPEGAHEINLVVAVTESRFVEFLAKPEQVKQ
jgi:hypothetical protein